MKVKVKNIADVIANLAHASYEYGDYPTRFDGYIPASDREWDKIVSRYSEAFDIADQFHVPPDIQKSISLFCLNAGKRKNTGGQ